ncbi:unnamed protein product, partial [Gongylonema pulchrum]
MSGRLFSDPDCRLYENEPNLWTEYLKRYCDINPDIRCACIKQAESILVVQPALRGQVTDALIARCKDSHQDVRLEVIRMVQRLARRKLEALSERLLSQVIDRLRDKK